MNDNLKWAAPDRYDLLKEFARINRQNPTFAEQILWQYLRDQALGTKFFRQYIIADYIVDFVSLQHQLVIEVDGAYHSEFEQMEYDELRTQHLESFGFFVIRFSNEQVQNDMPSVIDSIKSKLQQLMLE
ncbi:MAG: endonuclease domain-containing protein [Bacteroidaceae bacterium]|nr:endonuclease domain-containing protein [Bacteroidaceae bacterium]